MQKFDKPIDWTAHDEKRQRLANAHPLRYLFLEVTRRCNLKCQYCGSECTAEQARGEMSTAQWRRVIAEIADDFDATKIMIAVTGGEPMLRDGIFDIFAELHSRGFPFGMVTNGTRVDMETAKRLADCGIGSISISYDAPDELNDALRGKGCAAGVELAVKNLQASGYKGVLEIISTITKPVVPHLDDMRKRIAQMRVPIWRMAPVMPIGRAAERPDLLVDEKEVKTLLDFIVAGRKDGYKPVPSFSEEGFLGDDYEGDVRPYLYRCNAGITIAGILYDGRIGACPELADCFVQGHVNDDRFSDVWNTRYRDLRDRSWAKTGRCDGCSAWEPCRGGALHLYENKTCSASRCFYEMLCPTKTTRV